MKVVSEIQSPNNAFICNFKKINVCKLFSISDLMTGDIVDSAFFRIQDNGNTVSGGTLDFYGYTADGIISVSDGNQLSNFIESITVTDGNPLYVVDVTSFIQGLVDSNSQYAGILIKSSREGQGFFGGDLSSSEWNVAADRPQLSINYTAAQVPEPSTLAIFTLGMIGLASRRFKK